MLQKCYIVLAFLKTHRFISRVVSFTARITTRRSLVSLDPPLRVLTSNSCVQLLGSTRIGFLSNSKSSLRIWTSINYSRVYCKSPGVRIDYVRGIFKGWRGPKVMNGNNIAYSIVKLTGFNWETGCRCKLVRSRVNSINNGRMHSTAVSYGTIEPAFGRNWSRVDCSLIFVGQIQKTRPAINYYRNCVTCKLQLVSFALIEFI